MSSKRRAQGKNSKTKSNILKSYEECLKNGIPIGKIYQSDFTKNTLIKRYLYPPYLWNINLLSSNNKKTSKQHKNKKPIRKAKKTIKKKSISRKIKSKSSQRSKSKSKTKQRLKSRKR